MNSTERPINVLIVDDSRLMRDFLEKILVSDPGIHVVGKAPNPYVARDLIKQVQPDVITLDIMMPEMDGITFLKNLMKLNPLPVVMISALTKQRNTIALEALALGAVDCISKPSLQEMEQLDNYAQNLIQILKTAAQAKISSRVYPDKKVETMAYHSEFLRNKLIAIGGSTGGIEAIESILIRFPKTFPGIVITQHIRPDFVSAFANRINKLCHLTVTEAKEAEQIVPGSVYIAPGGSHLSVQALQGNFYCRLKDNPPVNGHKPSVDVLFKSVAKELGANAIAVLLTGMGVDGAAGAKAIHDAGGMVIAQDEESSVVWGMPGAAVKLKAANSVTPLSLIPDQIFRILDSMAKKAIM